MTIVLTELQHREIEEKSSSKLQAFQRKIYLKAKQNPKYKFYCLYDKVFRMDVLMEAYSRVKKSHGGAGSDGMTFEKLEGKETEYLEGIHVELKECRYYPGKLRNVEIPKKNGKMRTLKIPTIKDRIVQMAIKLVIEPIFEADFEENSYGYRPKKSAQQAIGKLQRNLFADVYKNPEQRRIIKSIDLSDCFNTIPHKNLMNEIAKRIIDRQLLKLIKSFLRNGGMEEEGGNGTPQGGVISPLLANIYLNQLDKYWKKNGKKSLAIRYADDTVILLHQEEEKVYEEFIRHIETDLRLRVNHEKTCTEKLETGVYYLGFKLKTKNSRRRKLYLSVEPSPEAMKNIKEKLKVVLNWRSRLSTAGIVIQANQILKGWQQYFDNIGMGKTRNHLNRYAELRLAKLISRRNKKNKICWKLIGKQGVYNGYGLHKMDNLGRIFT